ncbi:DUF444 family protein [bacterium]|nr:DUF444 family protein [bacterium]
MIRSGERERKRLKEKIKDHVKDNLERYIVDQSFIGRKGKKLYKIPLKGLRVPKFVHDWEKGGGVGQGEGDGEGEGKPVPGDGKDGAGNKPGQHSLEAEFTAEELAKILAEKLELPNIEERGKKKIVNEHIRFNDLRRVGPEATVDIRRTVKNSILRNIAEGNYDPEKDEYPPIDIKREDKRHRIWEKVFEKKAAAVIVLMMDVSGSMGDTQKDIVKTEMFWIETFLHSQYDGLEVVYIVHDTEAREVDRDSFYRIRESGGTNISSAYNLAAKIIEERYPVHEWNIYPFHFSDGDNWNSDNSVATELLTGKILPVSNMFCYGQVESRYGSGEFKKILENGFKDQLGEKLIISVIKNKKGILKSIKEFLGKGK